MENQFQYIHSLAKRFSWYNDQPKELFKALKELPAETLIQVTDEYWNPDANFQPVNLLRATIAKKLLEGETIKEEHVEEIKNRSGEKTGIIFPMNQYKELYGVLKETFQVSGLTAKSLYTGKMEEAPAAKVAEITMEYEREGNLSFWWLNANPKIWSISGCHEGQIQVYTTHNERGNKRRIYKYFEEVKPGDLLIGYESTPSKQVKAILEITKGIHTREDIGEVIELQVAKIFEYPVHWNDLKSIPALKDCEIFINNQGSLFALTEEEFDIIREVVDKKILQQRRSGIIMRSGLIRLRMILTSRL